MYPAQQRPLSAALTAWASGKQLRRSRGQFWLSLPQCQLSTELSRPPVASEPATFALDEDLTPQEMQQRKGLSSDFLGLKVRGFKPFFRGTTLKYRDGGVVRQCAKGGANKIRAPAPTVPGPRPAYRPEHTNVAMGPAEVLRQAGVSVSEEFDLGPALPFTMGTAGSDSEFHDCASPTASASRLMGTFSG
ncbi:TPA: hypothetical protein ACH3X3_011085 [Trebouxia sp. C0006]